MKIEDFKKMTKEQLKEYGKTIPFDSTYDDNGYKTSHKETTGFWWEATNDKNGNETSYRNCRGYWTERTYDNENEISFRNSNGYFVIRGKEVTKREYEKFMKGKNNGKI